MRDPIRHRDPDLVHAILDAIYTADGPVGDRSDDPIPWTDIVDAFTSDTHTWRTVENVLYELVQIGALHRVGKAARGHDTRGLRPTILGEAWRIQRIHPIPERTQP